MSAQGTAGADGGPAAPGKQRVRTVKVVDGHEIEEWIEVDDDGTAAWPPRSGMRLLNHDLERVDAPVKVSGRATYTHDVRLPGMLWARLLTSPLPVAKVTLDTAPALKVPGVRACIVLEGERVRFLGQPVAAVAADTPEAAEDGLRAIAAVFEPERWAVDREQALADGAPEVEEGGNRKRVQATGDRAAAEKALERCAVVVDATYTLPVQHHVALETHGLVVDFKGGEATVYASTQHVQGIARQVARPLGLAEADVRVHGEHMGGGFGAKFEIGVEGLAACRLARETERPIHLMLTRADEFLIAGNRSGARQHLKGGATADGKLVALVADVERHGGLGRGSHPGLPYVYAVESAFCEVGAVLMHTDASRAFRAPGHPQASFAMESWVDEVAHALAMDPLELRQLNVGEVWRRQLDECARRIGWYEHPHRTAPAPLGDAPSVGIGFAVATWGGGGRPVCEVDVVVARDGSVTASVGSQDLGTGTRTYLAAIVAEVLGLELGDVTARLGDNRYGNANPSGGSTTAASLAPAIYDAAVKVRDALAEKLSGPLSVPKQRIAFDARRVFDVEAKADGLTWQQACGMLGEDGVRARGTWQASLAASGVHGAQAARVEVDPLTGRVRVLRMVCVQDCGLPLNRLALRSQINGGMIQSLSYGLFEERVIDAQLGVALNANLEDYKIAGTLEIPELEVVIDEDERPVIGIGEPPIVPGQSAIANAVFNATGARVRDLPLTCDKVLMACEALRSST